MEAPQGTLQGTSIVSEHGMIEESGVPSGI
jgi:hypothetical protein